VTVSHDAGHSQAGANAPHDAGPHAGPNGGHNGGHNAGIVALAMGALGVVYGDIGTSPLYAFREALEGHELNVNKATIYGACSLVFWALLIIITIKYLFLVMRADNQGEGGILALTALISPKKGYVPGRRRIMLLLFGLFGCALLYGDGVITPAISVLSAIEGFEVASPVFNSWVIPISIVILVILFAVQRRGTEAVAKIFGPIMIVWFAVLAILGLTKIWGNPEILEAVNPIYAVRYFSANGIKGFWSLGSIFLVVTGGEALYADMGHFGRKPIAAGWFAVVLPCLLLNYYGQGALLLKHPEAIRNPLFLMGPKWTVYPLAILATAATVIASQALISGAFSLTAQAVQLDYLPRIQIRHTSESHAGQIYVPVVNWLLMIGCIIAVLGFRSSANLAAAYGIAVTSTMAITTLLFGAVAIEKWRWSQAKTLAICLPLLIVDLAFLTANIVKIPHGGWFALLIAVTQFFLMWTWRKGRALVAMRLKRGEIPIASFVDDLNMRKLPRLAGTAVFLFKDAGVAPPALITTIEHFSAVHSTAILLSIDLADRPTIPREDQVKITPLGSGFFQLEMVFGFMETIDVSATMAAIQHPELNYDAQSTTFFIGRETVVVSELEGMPIWQEHIFEIQNRTAASASRFFGLPSKQVFEVGTQVNI
jgi:KUP system potassium uptake protein